MSRVLRLEGSRNLRDLGGYSAADGRRVRWRKLFRSGSLGFLTDSDYQHLDGLGIRLVCDLRSIQERALEPFRNAGARPPTLHTWDYDSRETESFFQRFGEVGSDVTGIREVICDIYRSLPWQFAPHCRFIVTQLAAGSTPMIFNCSAGKDRTGIVAALVLTALGVPRSVVLEDYRLTETLLDLSALMAHGKSATSTHQFMSRLGEPARSLLFRSDPMYLEASFEAIERYEGSMSAFLERHLGLDRATTNSLQSHLLEG